MKKTAMAAVVAAVGVVGAAGVAGAADIPGGPFSAAPVPYPAFTWTGPYAGINFGYQWGSVTHLGAKPGGVMGGIQGGYNWQSGQFVYGLEADLQASAAEDTFAPYKFSNPWFGTLRGRAGYALNNILFYGTLGFAYGYGRAETPLMSESHLQPGWVAGGGLEVALTPRWSAKAEYLFVDLSDAAYAITGMKNGFESSVLRFGANYRF